MSFPLLPVLGTAAVAGLVALRLKKNAGAKSTFAPPPDFSTPRAQGAAPPGAPPSLPVLTQAQFNTLAADAQKRILEDAAKNQVATLSATNGTLFTSQMTPAQQADLANLPDGIIKPGILIVGDMVTVDAGLAARFGVSLAPVLAGNAIFQVTALDNGVTVAAVSRDPRLPGVSLNLPLKALTGAGDA
jgi:hypothetical protein